MPTALPKQKVVPPLLLPPGALALRTQKLRDQRAFSLALESYTLQACSFFEDVTLPTKKVT